MMDAEEGSSEVINDALQQPQNIEESSVQWEELHCRSGTEFENSWEPVNSEFLPLDGILSSTESIATNESLLSLTLSAAGVDFCKGNEAYPFQHFQYFPEESDREQIGWHVNCCDSPQQPDNQVFEPLTQSPTQNPTQSPTLAPSQLANTTKSQGFSEGLADQDFYVTPAPVSKDVEEVDFFPLAATQVFVSLVAAFFSLATILAMTLPLLKKRRRKRASTYNLYLVFLALPDLIYNVFLAYLFITYEEWITIIVPGEIPWIDHPYDLALFATCAAANLYMNAIIALEILKLLRNSKRRRRSKAPSLKKASVQALCTYIVGATIFAVDYNADKIKDKISRLPSWVIPFVYFTLTIALPMAILLWVCFRIYCEKLIGDVRTKAGKRLTILIRYFTRIIVVYICIWLPASILYLAQFGDGVSKKGFFYYIACILYALAAWANFGLSLTKPDVRRNFVDLFTGKAFLPDPKKEDDGAHLFTTSGNSGDGRPKENQVTTSTGEESAGVVNHIETDVEQGSPKCEKTTIKISFSGMNEIDDKIPDTTSEEDDEDDSNVFDFGGADAPIIREGSKHSQGAFSFMARRRFTPRRNSVCSGDARDARASVSESLRVAPRSSTYSNAPLFRSSLIRSQSEILTVSEPFELHSQSMRESSRLSMERPSFTSNTSRSLGYSNRSSSEPKKPTSIEQDNERISSVRLPSAFISNTGGSLSTNTGGTVSFFMMDRESTAAKSKSTESYKSGATTAFFMDADSSGRTITPTEHKNWIVGMKKNIYDLGRLLMKPDVSEEQKSVYKKSIYLNQKALQSVKSVSVSQWSSASINLEGADVSSGSELTNEIFPEEISCDDDDSALPEGSEHSKNSDNHDKELRYSKTRWLAELRCNIQDLNLRLEQEDLTEEDRMLISRAIESQKLTLTSIEGIDENADAGLFTSLYNGGNVDQSKTGSFITSSLDVIEDNSVSEH
eukprot:CAMPEP_0116145194 /NCGR_PEP_ID=MMETSP0329-20121206/16447_1 /TAXON_ID=697910 /ORGANISM="Pseudo-nitzschia arenysensis, Strain B593" /LENGTH=958 /DNA_ID=CAMNT_0003640751 /DNA_START=552 /DNA_END=3428 /DNA_ORIENTATION=-